uniref:Uncharacterized protein n=1 Tax=Setaria viridis TaxID=4556 RepID=A0A4U6SW12_SETVI|nr:hypothetical protein SEVIR_9G206600v2 [Setaria viridis]
MPALHHWLLLCYIECFFFWLILFAVLVVRRSGVARPAKLLRWAEDGGWGGDSEGKVRRAAAGGAETFGGSEGGNGHVLGLRRKRNERRCQSRSGELCFRRRPIVKAPFVPCLSLSVSADRFLLVDAGRQDYLLFRTRPRRREDWVSAGAAHVADPFFPVCPPSFSPRTASMRAENSQATTSNID